MHKWVILVFAVVFMRMTPSHIQFYNGHFIRMVIVKQNDTTIGNYFLPNSRKNIKTLKRILRESYEWTNDSISYVYYGYKTAHSRKLKDALILMHQNIGVIKDSTIYPSNLRYQSITSTFFNPMKMGIKNIKDIKYMIYYLPIKFRGQTVTKKDQNWETINSVFMTSRVQGKDSIYSIASTFPFPFNRMKPAQTNKFDSYIIPEIICFNTTEYKYYDSSYMFHGPYSKIFNFNKIYNCQLDSIIKK